MKIYQATMIGLFLLSYCESLASTYQEADRELNHIYSEVMTKIPESEQKQLKAAQRLWIKFRDAQCEAERTIGQIDLQQCQTDSTLERIKQLKALINQ